MSATCGSCGAPLEWAKTLRGRSIPVDPETVESGNLRVVDGIAYFGSPGSGDRVSHFATCPNADQHRRRD